MHIPQIHKNNSQKICIISIIYWLPSNKYEFLDDYCYFLRSFYDILFCIHKNKYEWFFKIQNSYMLQVTDTSQYSI